MPDMSTYVPVRVGQAIARLLANGELHLVVVVVLWYMTGVGGWVGVSASKKEQGVELGVIERRGGQTTLSLKQEGFVRHHDDTTARHSSSDTTERAVHMSRCLYARPVALWVGRGVCGDVGT